MTIYHGRMTTPSGPPSPADEVANHIEVIRKDQSRSVAWLSERSGIAYKTIRRRLYGDPAAFTLAELSAIARAFEVSLEHLIAPTAPAGAL